jgi:hypothetical protein
MASRSPKIVGTALFGDTWRVVAFGGFLAATFLDRRIVVRIGIFLI